LTSSQRHCDHTHICTWARRRSKNRSPRTFCSSIRPACIRPGRRTLWWNLSSSWIPRSWCSPISRDYRRLAVLRTDYEGNEGKTHHVNFSRTEFLKDATELSPLLPLFLSRLPSPFSSKTGFFSADAATPESYSLLWQIQ